MEDRELVQDLIKGKEDALNILQKKYGRLLYGICKDIILKTHSVADVEECYSDIVISIWNNILDFDSSKGKFINFIAAIAKYKAIDYKRKLDKNIEVEINNEILESSYIERDLEEDLEEFKELINILKEEDKQIFIKRYYFEEDIEKISSDLNISKDTVYKRLSRGREKLKSRLGEARC